MRVAREQESEFYGKERLPERGWEKKQDGKSIDYQCADLGKVFI
jgi:hypothetical protein